MNFELPRRRALDHLLRPTRAEVSADALAYNVRALRRLAGSAGILAVLKANAYGHGAVQVARVLEAEGVEMIGVALIEEGLELRNAGVKTPILVMGGSYEGGYELMVAHALTPTLFRHEHLQRLEAAAQRVGHQATAHLKLDTGMGRLGVHRDELPGLLAALKKAAHVKLEGFMSHFANADAQGAQDIEGQLARFLEGLKMVRQFGFEPKWRHLSNTAGLLTLAPTPELTLARPGLGLFGVFPEPWLSGCADLRPALSWKTGITHLKTVEAGTALSYGSTWVAPGQRTIATLPVGYADGFGRVYSNKGSVLIQGQRAQIVGRVTMDMCLVDVTHIEGVTLGDEVVLIGAQGNQRIDVQELATLAETIPYEVLCGVGARVPRVLV